MNTLQKSRQRCVIRLFFNCYYDDVVKELKSKIMEISGVKNISYVRSSIVKEFHFIEIVPEDTKLVQTIVLKVNVLLNNYKDIVYGVKIYHTCLTSSS